MRKTLYLSLLVGGGFIGAGGAAGEESPDKPAVKDGTGTLHGRVLFDDGAPPKGVVAEDTVVYLVGDGLIPKGEATEGKTPEEHVVPAVLDQKDITFVPHVLPVPVDTPVDVRNGDAILHNVHSNSAKNDSFNRAQPANGSFRVTYKIPEVIHVGCDIHSQMSAYIVVVPNRFFAKPAKDGGYVIAGVPPGKYQVVGWHEKYGRMTAAVEVGVGATTAADLNFVKKKPAGSQEGKP